MLHARFDRDEEGDEAQGAGDQRDRRRRAPPVRLGLHQGVDQEGQPGGDREAAGDVVRGPRQLGLRKQCGRQYCADNRDRDVDEEDPLPADGVCQSPSEQDADGAGGAAHRPPHAERGGQRAPREDRRQQREGRRNHERGSKALEGPRGDQRPLASGQAGDQGAAAEEGPSEHEDQAPSAEVGEASGEQ